MRLLRGAFVVSVLTVLIPATAGSGADATQIRTLRTAKPVTALAVEGARAAVATGCGARSFELVSWAPISRSVVSLGPARARACYGASTGEGVYEIGASAGRLAWVRFAGGNYTEEWLMTASLRTPRSARQITDVKVHNSDDGVGDWVGDVHGDGPLLVFVTWSACYWEPDVGHCPPGVPPRTYHTFDEKLWKIVRGRKRLLVASPTKLDVLAVAAGRILVQRADGSLELRQADGHLARVFRFGPDEVKSALLDGSDLVVLDRLGGRLRWVVFDAATGRRRRSFPAPGRAQPADLDRGLLVFVVDRVVHVTRVSDGRERRFVAPRGNYPCCVYAQIESAGLFYSYSLRGEGRVRFVPTALLGLR